MIDCMPPLPPVVAFALLASCLAVPVTAQDAAGTWFTSRGVLELEVRGERVSGRYGDGAVLEGRRSGRELEVEAREGAVELRAKLTFDAGGHRFTGEWRSAHGTGPWRGWRHDPAAAKGKVADVAGFWRTSWGMLELQQSGGTVKGGYGAQGWSTVRGSVKGRHLKIDYEAPFGNGAMAFDVEPGGAQALGGATSGDHKWALRAQRLVGHVRNVVPKPGAVVAGIAENRLVYWLHAPKAWKPGAKTPLLVMLHGSNYCSRPYVESIAGTPVGEHCIVVGIDGEAWVDDSAPDDPRQNYTYVNFMGRSTYQGFPNTHRESPALVAELIGALQRQLGSTRTFVGGHSQGGFLTWYLAMHFPELVHGVFPIAAGMTMQCEPDAFDDVELRRRQREVAIAVVHGRADDAVPFRQGESTWQSCLQHGFPALRLFASDAGHGFGGLPWIEAVQWLEALCSREPPRLAAFARQALAAGQPRDAIAALLRLRAVAPGDAAAKAIAAAVDERAAPDVARFAARLAAPGDGGWIDDFLAFRAEFEFADAAREVMAGFAALRTAQEPAAKRLFDEARAAMQRGDQATGWSKYEDLARTCWASSHAVRVRRWLAERR